MKTKFTAITISLFLLSICLQAQNAYYDAFMFEDLKLNVALFDADLKYKSTIKKFLINPFDATITQTLKDSLSELRRSYLTWSGNHRDRISPNGLSGLAFSVSSSSQSMIIDAVAKIVVEDFQNGANTVFINKIKEKLDKIPELQAFFPATYQPF